jgi:Protein of unknown function (DUF559)
MRNSRDEEAFRRLVARQYGRISWAQLEQLDVRRSTIHRWERKGHLVRVLPRVYAVGHIAPSRAADLWAAVLYAGPGAMLSHGTAAQLRGLIDHAPRVIEVSTPRKIKSTGGVKVYGRRNHDRYFEKDLPVTSIPQTLVDLAATSNLKIVRRALAQLDYRRQLDLQDLEALEAICSNGRPGSNLLRKALKIHQPELAHTNGPFEANFLEWCERWKVPVPSFNTRLHGVLVDAHWPGSKLVVELDGGGNHSSRAQLHRDKQNDLTLRRHGITVYRYDWHQLREQGPRIRDEILAGLGASADAAAGRGRAPPGARPR